MHFFLDSFFFENYLEKIIVFFEDDKLSLKANLTWAKHLTVLSNLWNSFKIFENCK